MSFLHVLSQIGAGVLKAAPVLGDVVGGPLGFAIRTGAGIASAELNHGPQAGAAKADSAMAVATASPALAASPLPADSRAQHIRQFIDAVVAALNAISALFPSPTPPTT